MRTYWTVVLCHTGYRYIHKEPLDSVLPYVDADMYDFWDALDLFLTESRFGRYGEVIDQRQVNLTLEKAKEFLSLAHREGLLEELDENVDGLLQLLELYPELACGEVDFRPLEMLPEDYYAP
jgi:hypothetical protein